MRGELVLGAVVLLAASLLHAHGGKPWPAPEAAKKRKNPVAATPLSLQVGAKLYRENCLVCHGEKGDGNGPWREKMPLDPPDFTDVHMMGEMSDGEIFWKVSTGRELMPGFQKQLSERQRWCLVNYLRTLVGDNSSGKTGR